jgi:hypothetical protein
MEEIKPTYVTFEQAKLLADKNFNELCNQGYNKSEEYLGNLVVNFPNKNSEDIVISAPEQWQVLEWLRLNHGIWIMVCFANKTQWFFDILNYGYSGHKKSIYRSNYDYVSPQEAYSAAFDYILKELI